MENYKTCELCGSKEDVLNFHHLIPRTLHNKKWYLKKYDKLFMSTYGIFICEKFCHKEIHKLISEKEMGKKYNTVEMLLQHPKVKKYIDWRSQRN